MGSMNFSIHPAARRITQWQHDWEKPYIEGMEDLIFRNTFRDIRHILKVLGEECGTRFEFECYDMGHRSEERRVGKECVSAGRSRWSLSHSKQTSISSHRQTR